MKQNKAFSMSELLIMLLVFSVLILASLPVIIHKKNLSGNNIDAVNCIEKEKAANLSSASCSAAINNSVKEYNNAYNTILSYIDSPVSANDNAAKTVIRELCNQGNNKSCKFFINKCLLDINNCNDSTDYDLNYFLIKDNNDVSVTKIKELITKNYLSGDVNIIQALKNSCKLNNSSVSCSFLKDKCDDGDEFSCSYFVDICKDSNICNASGSENDLYYLVSRNGSKMVNTLVNLISPYYGPAGNTNITSVIDNACLAKPSSLACLITSPSEKRCNENNDDAACSEVANQCQSGDNRKCKSIITACNNGQTNACKYGYLYNISRSCSQIKTKTGNLFANGPYSISLDNVGTSKRLNCSDDWTEIVFEDYSSTTKTSMWSIAQSAVNRTRYDYLDKSGNPVTNSHYILGGQTFLSGTGYDPNMYLQRTFDLLGIPHTTVRSNFYIWYCGPWSGEKYFVHYNGILNYTSAALSNSTASSWKTWDNTQDCRPINRDYSITDSNSNITLKISSNLTSSPVDKSLGVSQFYLYVK